MTDDTQTAGGNEQTGTDGTDNAATSDSDKSKNSPPETIPYRDFKKKNDALRAAEARVAELEGNESKAAEDREKIRKQQLADDGNHKVLLEEANAKLETVTSERDEFAKWKEDYVSDRREALTQDMSDEDKAIAATIPDLKGLEAFAIRIKPEILPRTDTRRSSNGGIQIKPLKEMTRDEVKGSHATRLAQYR